MVKILPKINTTISTWALYFVINFRIWMHGKGDNKFQNCRVGLKQMKEDEVKNQTINTRELSVATCRRDLPPYPRIPFC